MQLDSRKHVSGKSGAIQLVGPNLTVDFAVI